MVIGVLRVEVHLPRAQSLKDKRSVVKRLREQLRSHFNVAVAEVEATEKWQRATVGIAAIGQERALVQRVLQDVTQWVRLNGLVELISLEEDYA